MSNEKKEKKRRDQKEVMQKVASDLVELSSLVQVIEGANKVLRQNQIENMLAIPPQFDVVDGASQRMRVIIGGMMNTTGVKKQPPA